MIALISITVIQLIIDIMMYQQMQQQKKDMDKKIQRYRQEQLELIHQHQQWIEITQRGSTLHGLRQQDKTLLQEEKNRVTV